MKPLFIIVLVALTPLCLAAERLALREVLLDNESVEVVRLTYQPGAESGMHTHRHPNRAVYLVEGGRLELVSADERQSSRVLDAKTGTTLFLPATTHNVRNIGDTKIIIIETEIK